MGHLGESAFRRHALQILLHAYVDTLSSPATSASEVVMVIAFVSQAIHLRPVFPHATLGGPSLLEGLQTAVHRHGIAGTGIQHLEDLVGGKRTFCSRQGPKDGPARLGHPQTRRPQGLHRTLEQMRITLSHDCLRKAI